MSYPKFTKTELEHEVWVTIPGFEGRYEVSNLGRVKGLRPWRSYTEPRILACSPNSDGYASVRLYRGHKDFAHHKVHRLVLSAFLGNDVRMCNHKNGIKLDNRLSNLEYATASENIRHAYQTGLTHRRQGVEHHKAKLTEADVLAIRELIQRGLSHCVIAERFGVEISRISNIKLRKSWRHI